MAGEAAELLPAPPAIDGNPARIEDKAAFHILLVAARVPEQVRIPCLRVGGNCHL
ncbi:hypothetical protein ABZ622_40540 [Streptomyces sp. NPDC007164]|uniref:hypothetical protein n=1 Tax=Streptomyces sp. NPDC007164 TaxID=3156918 RepID=UPI00340062D8